MSNSRYHWAMTSDSLRQNVRPINLRFRAVLRAEIAARVQTADDIDDKLAHLLQTGPSIDSFVRHITRRAIGELTFLLSTLPP